MEYYSGPPMQNYSGVHKNAETLARVFGRNGYHTGYIGKWHLGSDDPVKAPERGGYQSWLAANLLEFSSDSYDAVLFDEANRRRKLPGYRVDALTDAAIRFCDEHQHEPFFLFLSYLEPHHQNHLDNYPPPRGRGLDSGHWVPPDLVALKGTSPQHLPGYYGMVRRLDEAFGRLMDALISLDLINDTIVLFTSDHGCHFKTRNGEYKRSCHESSIRVPTMITGPGFFGGGEIRQIFGTIDVAPTLIDAAGLPVPPGMEGRSILPVLRDRAAPWREDILIQISESETARALRSARWKYSVTAPYDEAASSSATYREAFLYDLDNDPYELVNLAGMSTFRGVADQMKSRLLGWIHAIEGSRPVIEEMSGTDALQLIPAKGSGVSDDRLGIDPYRSPLLKI